MIIDNFAGGGGASLALEQALGRPVDIAINHDARAVAMHKANFPNARHICQDVWTANPRKVCAGQPVDVAWFSPDCTHHSKAKGGKPIKKKIRSLAWVVLKWAALVRPAQIFVENVEEFEEWGPLTRGKKPCKRRKGMTFRQWVTQLEDIGYDVEWRRLRACDYGAPTIRNRLFLVARCDGAPIAWPKPTHGPDLTPFRTAAECLDWSIPCPSIFGRKRPLAENTLKRIAKGIQRFVIEADEPFIVRLDHTSNPSAHEGVSGPLTTVTSKPRHWLVEPFIERYQGRSEPQGAAEPLSTITSRSKQALVTAFMAQHNTGMTGHPMTAPVSTIVGRGTTQGLVTSHLLKLRGTCQDGQPVTDPMPTITAGGTHVGEVRAFLLKYYSTAPGQSLDDPLHSVTTRARFGLVTVEGVDYQIVDIGMRMLEPRELFNAQGFPASYVIDPIFEGRYLSKTQQNNKCGNSVSPPPAIALLRANNPEAAARAAAA